MASLNNANDFEGIRVSKLSDVYPNIEEQLCSKHSLNMTRIKHKFEALYSQWKPSKFVVAKGVTSLVKNNINDIQQPSCLMAIQQGIIIAVAKTQPKSNIFINYNKWESQASSKKQTQQTASSQFIDELMLSATGSIVNTSNIPSFIVQLEQGNKKSLAILLSSLYSMVIEDISLNKLNGMIIYINSSLADSCFYEAQAIMWAFYIAVLDTSQVIHEYSLSDLKSKMLNWAKINLGTQKSITKLMQYGDFILQFQHNTVMRNKQLESAQYNKSKLIFCKIPVSLLFSKQKQQSIIEYLQNYQNQLFKQGLSFYQILHLMKIYYLQKKQTFPNKNQFMDKINIHIGSCEGLAICEGGKYLVMQFANRNVPDVIRSLIIHTKQYESSEHNPQLRKDIVQNRDRKYGQAIKIGKWGSNSNIQQSVFSSAPSVGLSILDPKDQIWYIQ